MCNDPCLFLTRQPLDQLAASVRAACGKELDAAYTSDCKKLDYARNCIFASHGMIYRKKKWAIWKTKPWYKRRPEFRTKELSVLELANVHELHLRAKACRKGVTVSSQDHARAQAWITQLAKGSPTMPAVVFVDSEAAPAAELLETSRSLGLKLTKETTIAYGELPSGVNARAGTTLRTLVIYIPTKPPAGPCDEDCDQGTKLALVYNSTDELVAVALEMYVW